MRTLITKAQIANYVTLTQNIADLDVNSFISDTQEFDTVNVFPEALLQAISDELDIATNWAIATAYVTGNIVLNGTYFTAISNNTGSEPPSANWEDNELLNFYLQYLLPFMAFHFYYRFIAYHGAKITQSGITQQTGDTFEQVSDTTRSRMLGDIKSKMNVWTNKVNKKLKDVNWTFDTVQYLPEDGKNKRVKQGVRIYALGSRNNKRGYRSIDDIC